MPFCTNCGSDIQGQFCASCGQRAGATAGGGAAAAAGGLTDNVAGLLCYIAGFITGILFLVLEPYKGNRFIRFHAFQSIFLSVAWFVVAFLVNIVSGILGSISWSILGLFGVLMPIVGVCFLAVVVVAMVKAYQGERWKVPVIGDYAEKQA